MTPANGFGPQQVIGTMFGFLPNDSCFIPGQSSLQPAGSFPVVAASTGAIPRYWTDLLPVATIGCANFERFLLLLSVRLRRSRYRQALKPQFARSKRGWPRFDPKPARCCSQLFPAANRSHSMAG